MRRWIMVLLAALAACAGGCAGKKQLSADEYYDQASEDFRLGAYGQSVENYRNLLDEHPFSEYSEEAELKIGVAHYKDRACPEATAAFTDFQRRHPTSANLALVGYLLGRCAEEQMQPHDRDQSASQNAHAYFQALIQQYPTSPYAELARQRLLSTRETLAEHEFRIAQYYASHDNPRGAEIRLIDLISRFNDTDVAGDALLELGELYKAQGQTERAVLAFAAVPYHHPDHNAAQQATSELDDLVPEGERPTGDTWAVLKAQSGRSRTIAISQSAPRAIDRTRQATGPGGPVGGSGFGLPGNTGPFGRGGSSPGRY